MTGTVLVVDDERNIRRTLRMVLEGEGVEVREAASAEDAYERLVHVDPLDIDVAIVDVRLPGMSGLELLQKMHDETGGPRLPLIFISGHASMSDAVHATRLGAFDFFEKPLDRERTLVSVRNALRQAQLDRELAKLRNEVYGEIIGRSQAMSEVLSQVDRVGKTSARVLITGESGTGKELIARAIHASSDRFQRPFVKVNCAAIPRELIESELFGHERGAFTGANSRRQGLFELAHRGTILLDEIGDMELGVQAKVLRVLQEGEMMRVGGRDIVTVDVRVLASTHRNLSELVAQGRFREDLFFRLNVVPIHVPALRERPDDIPALVRHFVRSSCRTHGLAERRIDDDALAALTAYRWPGNVRELRNIVERMVVLSDSHLTRTDVPDDVLGDHAAQLAELDTSQLEQLLSGDLTAPLKQVREAVERAYIRAQLNANGWNVSRTAAILGLERSHLHRKMKLLDIARGK
ncbi:MAG: sigma-54-dependent Fis family transcriptional regulator [Myxococcales bacterium FL481]|nr:MAG: sigma-54-dependent Fis family transcriptional regulator [Myxococcales bacterium FL481]